MKITDDEVTFKITKEEKELLNNSNADKLFKEFLSYLSFKSKSPQKTIDYLTILKRRIKRYSKMNNDEREVIRSYLFTRDNYTLIAKREDMLIEFYKKRKKEYDKYSFIKTFRGLLTDKSANVFIYNNEDDTVSLNEEIASYFEEIKSDFLKEKNEVVITMDITK